MMANLVKNNVLWVYLCSSAVIVFWMVGSLVKNKVIVLVLMGMVLRLFWTCVCSNVMMALAMVRSLLKGEGCVLYWTRLILKLFWVVFCSNDVIIFWLVRSWVKSEVSVLYLMRLIVKHVLDLFLFKGCDSFFNTLWLSKDWALLSLFMFEWCHWVFEWFTVY